MRARSLAAVVALAACGGPRVALDVPIDPGLPSDLAPASDPTLEPAADPSSEPVPEPPADLPADPAPDHGQPLSDDDRDGVPLEIEVAAGTDPHDPSSAPAWHPELTVHPRLFFGPEDVDELRARKAAETGPWPVLYARLRGAADSPVPSYPADGTFDVNVSPILGRIAEGSAFVGLLDEDPAASAKAAAILAAPFPDPSGLGAYSDYDLTESEALVSMCTAFDLLAGTPGVDPSAVVAARVGLIARLHAFRKTTHEGSLWGMVALSRNNHAMKVAGALGLCALAINDRPTAARDLSAAMTVLDWLLNHYQSTEDGGYAEGTSYLTYGSRSYLPFLAAWHRFAGGETFPFFGVPEVQPSSPHQGKVSDIADFAVNPRTRAVYTTAVWASRPDGLSPGTDDSFPASQHGGVLWWMFGDPVFLWQWFRPVAGLEAGGAEVASYALYDGTPPPEVPPFAPPFELSGSRQEAGFAILRDGWSSLATYLNLQGEHGAVRVHGEGHEHPDELSFVLYAHGSPLVLDPGYIDFDNHALVNKASDHNTILVDGEGAPSPGPSDLVPVTGVDAFLTPLEQAGEATTWVAVSTSYRGVSFTRRVVRASGLFVVDDRIDAHGSTHAYTFLLNGLGGGDVPDSTFTLLPDGGRWVNPTARIEARVLPTSDGPFSVTSDLEEHEVGFGQWAMHARLKVEATMAGHAGFLTVLFPGEALDEPPAEVAAVRPEDGVAAFAFMHAGIPFVVVSNRTAGSVQVTVAGTKVEVPPGLLLRCAGETVVLP